VLVTTRTRDITVAVAGLAVGAFPACLIAVAIKLDTDGPVLYRRRCYGRYGRPFTLFRFRTMREPPDGSRTRVGRLLIRWSLDEWPLLWNVLHGDMSLVGPRAEEVGRIDPVDPLWAEALRQRPGVTSAALVAFGGDFNHTAPEIRRAVELDHARSTEPSKDLRVIWATVAALLERGNIKRARR
jgi:lipopolysaccharide/colanic/teichoic acid biosynthesis glycosyltransferase